MRPDADLDALLEQLDDEERRISARRAQLHARIDFLRANGNANGMPATREQLEMFDEQERTMSKARKDLHARIRELRAERDRRDRKAG